MRHGVRGRPWVVCTLPPRVGAVSLLFPVPSLFLTMPFVLSHDPRLAAVCWRGGCMQRAPQCGLLGRRWRGRRVFFSRPPCKRAAPGPCPLRQAQAAAQPQQSMVLGCAQAAADTAGPWRRLRSASASASVRALGRSRPPEDTRCDHPLRETAGCRRIAHPSRSTKPAFPQLSHQLGARQGSAQCTRERSPSGSPAAAQRRARRPRAP